MAKHGVTEFLSVFNDVGIIFFDIESDLLVVLDEQGNIDRVNQAFERVLSLAEPDVLGESIIKLILIDDWSKFLNSFDDLKRGKAFHLLHKDAGLIKVQLVSYRFKRTDLGQRGYLVLRPVQ